MSNASPSRARLGCVLQLLGLAVVAGFLTCSGLCGASYLAFFTGIGGPPPERDRPLAIRGGTVWDGTERGPKTGQLVLIEDGRITCAGKDCGVPAHAEVLEATGLFYAPGLVDLHVHFGAPAAGDADRPVPSLMWETLRHRPRVRRAFLEHGVTSIRSVGDDLRSMQNQQTWLDSGTLGGPALYFAGPVFTAPGGHPADKLLENAPWLVDGSTRQVSDPDRARTRVHALLDSGVDGIKVVYDDVEGTLPKLDATVMEAVIEEARGRDAWVAAHTGTDADVQQALAAGATTIEHGARDHLSDETLRALKEADVVYVPTLAVTAALLPEVQGQAMTNALRAWEAGVRVGVGSDTQGPEMAFGDATVAEVLLLVKAGIPVLGALRGATEHAAHALDRTGELGVIAEGARADLVFYAGDPTEDPTVLTEPVLVLQEGRIAVDRR